VCVFVLEAGCVSICGRKKGCCGGFLDTTVTSGIGQLYAAIQQVLQNRCP